MHGSAIKNQWKARNAPCRGLWVPWASSLWHKRVSKVRPRSQPIIAQCLDDLDQWEVSTLSAGPGYPRKSAGQPKPDGTPAQTQAVHHARDHHVIWCGGRGMEGGVRVNMWALQCNNKQWTVTDFISLGGERGGKLNKVSVFLHNHFSYIFNAMSNYFVRMFFYPVNIQFLTKLSEDLDIM